MVAKKLEKPQPQHILQKVLSNQTGEALMVTTHAPNISAANESSHTVSTVSSTSASAAATNKSPHLLPIAQSQQQPQPHSSATPPSSSLIKSLLANKVTTTGTLDASQVTATNQPLQQPFGSASKLITANVNVHQVTPVCDVLIRLT